MRPRGNQHAKTATTVERFARLLVPEPNSGCYLWLGAYGENGYGNFKADRRSMSAHCWAYELANGPIPAGMVVRHKCDTPACVNPDHLILGTQAENIRDSIERGRFGDPRVRLAAFNEERRTRTHCKRGHEYTEANTYRYLTPRGTPGRGCKTCRNSHVYDKQRRKSA